MRLFRSLYRHLPLPVRQGLRSLQQSWWAVRGLRIDLWKISGEERHSHLPLSVLCALPSQEKTLMTKLMFADWKEEHMGRAWSWNMLKAAGMEKAGCSLVALKVEKPQFRSKAGQGWFIIPTWVKGDIDVPLDPKLLHSRSVKTDLKKIREHRLEPEITRDPGKFEWFYREMHVPYLKEIRGKAAYIESYEKIRSRLSNCELFLIKKDGEYMSGAIIAYEGRRAHFWLLGVRNGDREYLKIGAVMALYYLALDRAAERGCNKADVGWSRAFLNDGPLRYKRKLAMQITESSGRGIALKTVSFDPAARSFLRNNPFIFENPRGLCGAFFKDDDLPLTAPETDRIRKDYLHPGMAQLLVYRLPEVGAPGQPNALQQLYRFSQVGLECERDRPSAGAMRRPGEMRSASLKG